MHIAFIDPTGRGYDPLTPLRQPTGGTESAVAFLSAALARQGVQVSLLNNAPQEAVVEGVRILVNGTRALEVINTADMVVAVSSPMGLGLRPQLVSGMPLVLWCHLAANQKVAAPLGAREEQDAWSAFVMVSRWQVENYAGTFGLSREKAVVIGNAVSPAFAAEPLAPAWFETGAAPVLAYTSTPFRGLDFLLMAFPSIRALVPDAELKVFSGMALYGQQGPDPYRHLYELARALPGVDYRGVVSQAALARELAGAAVLSYPSTFAETSCIAAMEAMALGLEPVTTDLGALPETMAGFGRTTPVAAGQPALVYGFVEQVVEALTEARRDPAAAAERRARQVAFVRQNYSWDARAQSWMAMAEAFMRARRDRAAPNMPAS